VRSAPASRSASCGGKILGKVRGTRTSGTVRDRRDPPCRRVSSPRGTVRICGSPGARLPRGSGFRASAFGSMAAGRVRIPGTRTRNRGLPPLARAG
jgi:hypothetical protein